MSLASLLTQTATVLPRSRSASSTDAHGHRRAVAGDPVSYPALLQRLSAEELAADRSEQRADWRLVLPAGAVIDGDDQVQVDGVPFVVVGPPDRPRTPRGEHHVEARLRSVS